MKLKYNNYIIYSILTIYLLINFLFNEQISNNYTYLINPLFWIILSIITLLINFKTYNNIRKYNSKLKTILILTFIYLILYYLSGIIFGYSKSIYATDYISIIKNIYAFIIVICCKEFVRYNIIKEKKLINYIIITILLIISDISITNLITYSQNFETLFKYFFSTLFPIITQNILSTILCLKLRYLGVFIYRFFINIFTIIVPINPNLNWYLKGIIEGLYPFIIMFIINYNDKRKNKENKKNIVFQIFYIALLIVFGLFIGGYFKYSPLVIVSNSMRDTLSRGDIVIIKKGNNNLKVGDIIEFHSDNMLIVHRIVEIDNKNNNIFYSTKGDNNEYKDISLLTKENIKGKVIFNIKYLGYPTIFFQESLK